jgi:hypothetical protein
VAHRKVAALAGAGESITRVANPRRREENDVRVMAFLYASDLPLIVMISVPLLLFH